jgi:hypothetical protein
MDFQKSRTSPETFRLTDVGFLRILGALEGYRALESPVVQPFGEANPGIALRLAQLPDATLLVL